MKLSEISDTVKMGTVVVTIIVGATTTTWAVKANTEAVRELTVTLKEHGQRITALETRNIAADAYAQAIKDIHAGEHDN